MTKNNEMRYTIVNRGDTMNEPLTTGIDDFKKVIDRKMYYVDKSLLIRDLLRYKGDANLITRPRRFGKSLNMSMLKYFFDINEKENAYLFDGLKINEWEDMKNYQNKYPVIFLSFKEFDFSSYELAFKKMQLLISIEYSKYSNLIDILTLQREKEMFIRLMNGKSDLIDLHYSLKFLSELLERYYHQKTIILIDEYDVPLSKSYIKGYYDEMVELIRGMFAEAFKGNNSLEFGVITGCLRISKESLFTGMNNFTVFDITNKLLSEYFGFTHEEVVAMLENDLLQDKLDDVEKWYNGYKFGDIRIYNPFSIINVINVFRNDKNVILENYWSNTSGNDFIYEMFEKNIDEVDVGLGELIKGHSIETNLKLDLTYQEVMEADEDMVNYLWSYLLMTGYLTIESRNQKTAILKIPNAEVLSIFIEKLQIYSKRMLKKYDRVKLIEAIHKEDIDYLEEQINLILNESLTNYDVLYENSYHMLMNGLFINNKGYIVKSNTKVGNKRLDISIETVNRKNYPIIIEIKKCIDARKLDLKLEEAINQIKDNKYYEIFNNYKEVYLVGMAFNERLCRIRIERMVLD